MSKSRCRRILYVAPSCSVHTRKWCDWFCARGYEVHVATFDRDEINGAITHHMGTVARPDSNDGAKLAYLAAIRELKRIEREVNADIVHVHYASSYGTIASFALEGPYFLSVWGADVYDFPKKSPFHRALIRRSLRKASYLMSTSRAMAEEASSYTDKRFEITPFGVDPEVFFPSEKEDREGFVVGTVKGLSSKYGIDILLRACALVLAKCPELPLKVKIAGKGPDERNLKDLACELGIEHKVEWLGFVEPADVPSVWQSLDVAVVPSILESESFGVSAVEAQACAVPVIVSDIPGLLEATDSQARVVVPRGDADALSSAIIDLYRDLSKRRLLGERGRDYVVNHLSLVSCFESIERCYAEAIGD